MNEIELLRQEVANIFEQQIAQIAQLQTLQTAQKGAWMLLLGHLSKQGYAKLDVLQKDLETQSGVETDAGLQQAYLGFASAVQTLRKMSSGKPR